MEAPKQIVNQLTHNPILFGVGAIGGATVLSQTLNKYVPNQTLVKVDKMSITVTDVATVATGAAFAAVGHKIPMLGEWIGEGGAKAIGAGIMGGVGYSKLAQEFGLPTIAPAQGKAGVFGDTQPLSQAYYGGFRSFSGDISI